MRAIASCPGYLASDDGRIWRNNQALIQRDNGHGYLIVTISLDGVRATKYIHRLVCEAYYGPPPKGHECRHRDGRRSNNVPGNLSWSTKAENEADKIAHGTVPQGERNGQAILTKAMVIDARLRTRCGEAMDAIARAYGVAPHTLRDAVMGRKWKTIPGALAPYSTRRRFTEDQVREIRLLCASSTRAEVAKIFNVTASAIEKIARREAYAHVT